MYRSWRRRTARDESLSSYPLPESLGAPVLEAEVLYVATTPVGDPLERLAVQGSHSAALRTSRWLAGGVVLRVAGESTTFIPADRLVGASTASYVIDRGVEPDGPRRRDVDASCGRPRRPGAPRRQLPSRPLRGRRGQDHPGRQRHRRGARRVAAEHESEASDG